MDVGNYGRSYRIFACWRRTIRANPIQIGLRPYYPMATINYAFKEISCKIVYYGPGLCGKTTNLIKIHEKVPARHRGDLVSVATEQDRTLFFDFLPIDLGEIKGFRTKFQIYTVPGQVFYNATRKLVLRGADGVVFVADSAADKLEENLESFQNLIDNLAENEVTIDQIPVFIQYNKRDLPNALPLDTLQSRLNKHDLPWLDAVAVRGKNVSETLKRISGMVLQKLRRTMEHRAHQGPTVTARTLNRPPKSPAAAGTATGPEDPGKTDRPSPPRPSSGAMLSRFGLSASGKLDFVLPIKQQCDVYWKKRRLGRAFVEFEKCPLSGLEGAGDQPMFQIRARIRFALLFSKRVETRLRFFGSEIRNSRIGEFSYSTFCPDKAAPRTDNHLFVWVRNGRIPKFYLRRMGMLGEYLLTPEGDGCDF